MSDDKPEFEPRHVKSRDWCPTPKTQSNSRLADKALNNAAVERRLAERGGKNAAMHLAEAVRLESHAVDLMKPPASTQVKSGEVAFVPGESGPPATIADTLANPDMAAIEASIARTELLATADRDLPAMAIDAATSANASNPFEKMLTHQSALIHTLVMKTGARALEIERHLGTSTGGVNQASAVEVSRLSQATSRLSLAFQGALLTLQRLRNGSSQTVTVRHVTVQPGAQAIIGNVKAGGRGRRASGRGKTK